MEEITGYIVVYRPHGELECSTGFIGPFDTHEEAYERLCELPALGINETGEDYGCKYIVELKR